MVMDIFGSFSLSPEQAEVIAAAGLAVLITLDVYAWDDDIAGNTPRELILRLTKWKSSVAYFPLTGAFVPFGFAALVGHFFHPWSESGPMPEGLPGLGMVLAIAAVLSLGTYLFDDQIDGRKWILGLALFGLIAGAVLWPVSA